MVPLSLAILSHCILHCIADTFDLNAERDIARQSSESECG